MNVTDLKKILDEIPDSDDEMEVFVEADHGQDLESAHSVTVEKAYKDGGQWFDVHPDDVDDYEDDDLERILIISGV